MPKYDDAPLPPPRRRRRDEDDDDGGVKKLIPYKNPKALIGYYVSIAGLFPFLGLPFAIAAVVLGIMGLIAVRREPRIHGTVHAIIALVLGVIASGYNSLFILILIVGMMQKR